MLVSFEEKPDSYTYTCCSIFLLLLNVFSWSGSKALVSFIKNLRLHVALYVLPFPYTCAGGFGSIDEFPYEEP